MRDHARVGADRGGDAAVRRGEQHPPGLERSHARDLQVLARRKRIAEPRDVGDVDEQRRGGELSSDLRAEYVLVADVDCNLLARDRERRLPRLAA